MGDSSLVIAVAQWVSTIGVPALFVAWYRLWQKVHEQAQEIAVLKSLDLGKLSSTVTEIRIIVGELKVRMDYQTPGRRAGERD